MRIFIAFKKVKLVDDIPIGNEEERALRAEIDPRHLSTRTEFSIETLNEKDVILVDGPDTRYGFIGEINPLLSGPRYDRFRENAVSYDVLLVLVSLTYCFANIEKPLF